MSKQLKIDSNDFEVSFVEQAKKCLPLLKKKLQLEEFTAKINKEDLFLFNAEGKAQVGWKEINNYQATSTNVKNTTQNLLEYFFESRTDYEKDELKL